MQLTEEMIDAMEAGSAMNALIEARIFHATPLTEEEWMLVQEAFALFHNNKPSSPFVKHSAENRESGASYVLSWPQQYSDSDWHPTWLTVVHRLRVEGWKFSLMDFENGKRATFYKPGFVYCDGEGDTDALAICRAALKTTLEK